MRLLAHLIIPHEVVDFSSGTVKRLTNHNPWLSQIKMPKQETVNYKAKETGSRCKASSFIRQTTKMGKRYPMIMMVHGGPESHVSDEWLDQIFLSYQTRSGQRIRGVFTELSRQHRARCRVFQNGTSRLCRR